MGLFVFWKEIKRMNECGVCLFYLGTVEQKPNPGTLGGWKDHVEIAHRGDLLFRVLTAWARQAEVLWDIRELTHG